MGGLWLGAADDSISTATRCAVESAHFKARETKSRSYLNCVYALL